MSPLYTRWVFSPTTGDVDLSDNSGDPLSVKYHSDLARERNEANLVHGYAYRIGNGWRLTDWENKPLSDHYTIASVMRSLQGSEPASEPEDGSWDMSEPERWDRVHHGLPS